MIGYAVSEHHKISVEALTALTSLHYSLQVHKRRGSVSLKSCKRGSVLVPALEEQDGCGF